MSNAFFNLLNRSATTEDGYESIDDASFALRSRLNELADALSIIFDGSISNTQPAFIEHINTEHRELVDQSATAEKDLVLAKAAKIFMGNSANRFPFNFQLVPVNPQPDAPVSNEEQTSANESKPNIDIIRERIEALGVNHVERVDV